MGCTSCLGARPPVTGVLVTRSVATSRPTMPFRAGGTSPASNLRTGPAQRLIRTTSGTAQVRKLNACRVRR